MEIKNNPAPSVETTNNQVLIVVRFNCAIECVLLILIGFVGGQTYFHSYYTLQWPLIVMVGLEAISAHIAIKKRQHWSLIVMVVLMIVLLFFLCMYLIHLVKLSYQNYQNNVLYEYPIFELIHTVIGIGLLVFALSKVRAISRWIKEDNKPEAVAYFQSTGSPYPSGPSNPTFSTTNNAHATSGSPYPSGSVAPVGSIPPVYPTTAHSKVPPQPNNSPNPSMLACPSYSTVGATPYHAKEAPYPVEQTHSAYPTAAANPAVYPSLDTQVPIQNTDPPTHPTP